MIYFTREAQEKLDKLFYYPYTFGKHIDKANRDLQTIERSLPYLPLRIGTHTVTIRGIVFFTYLCNGRDVFIQFITWSTVLTKVIIHLLSKSYNYKHMTIIKPNYFCTENINNQVFTL